jgi:hypothetical protein
MLPAGIHCLRRIGTAAIPAAFVALTFFPSPLHAQEETGSVERVLSESAQDSLAREVRKAMAGMTTAQLEERKANRRLLQQRGYAEILSRTLAADGLGALIAYCRSALRLEFSLPRNTLVVYISVNSPPRRDSLAGPLFQYGSGPLAVPLLEDRSFPADPWGKR